MSDQYAFDQSWEQEQARLRYLEQWLDDGTFRLLERAGFVAGARCLEVGGGHGSIARRMAQAGADVVATDLDTTLLDGLEGVDVRRHDITTGAPEPEAFDVVHARMVLGWIAERDKAIGNMVDALRPGGVLLIEELDNVTHLSIGSSPSYERVIAGMNAGMKLVGYDIELGRRLPWVLHAAGLENIQAEGRVEYGPFEGGPALEMFTLTLQRMREPLVAVGPATSEDVDETIRVLRDPSFEKMPPTVVAAWGRKP